MLRSTNYSRTPASTEPVTIDDVRKQLRIDHTDDDDDLTNLISEARFDCESRLGDVSLFDAVCVDYFDRFEDEMELHYSPVDSITSVAYLDTNGSSQTLASTYYEVGNRNGMGILRLKYGQTWPSTRDHADVITITYKAGFGTTAASVPLCIRRWIKARVAWLWGNRDGEEYPWNFDGILAPYKTCRVVG